MGHGRPVPSGPVAPIPEPAVAAPPLDLEAQIARLQGIRAAFEGLRIVPDEFVADGDRVSMRATLHGTHRGEFFGIPGTGRTVKATVIDVIRVEDGMIVEQWGGPNVIDILSQIGAEVALPD
jgi:predicted ester cyclase